MNRSGGFEVAIFKNDEIVGHVPRARARTCRDFLKIRYSRMSCTINGEPEVSKIEGKGFVFPCVYYYHGQKKDIFELIELLW